MIDMFTLALTHGLLALAALRLLARDDLDRDGAPPVAPVKRRRKKREQESGA